MPNRLLKFVAWTTLAQVMLVGGLGAGLHTLLGCEHPCCSSACCRTGSASAEDAPSGGCDHCAFCERRAGTPGDGRPARGNDHDAHLVAGCDGCTVCDLLAQYHSVTPFYLAPIATELAAGEAVLQHQNAVVAAKIRFCDSRGPPVV